MAPVPARLGGSVRVPAPTSSGCRNEIAPVPVRLGGPLQFQFRPGRHAGTRSRRFRCAPGTEAVPDPLSPGCWSAMVPVPVRLGGSVRVPEAANNGRAKDSAPVPVLAGGAAAVPAPARPACWNAMAPVPVRLAATRKCPKPPSPTAGTRSSPVPVRFGGAATVPVPASSDTRQPGRTSQCPSALVRTVLSPAEQVQHGQLHLGSGEREGGDADDATDHDGHVIQDQVGSRQCPPSRPTAPSFHRS